MTPDGKLTEDEIAEYAACLLQLLYGMKRFDMQCIIGIVAKVLTEDEHFHRVFPDTEPETKREGDPNAN
jgi:hypothetical protein